MEQKILEAMVRLRNLDMLEPHVATNAVISIIKDATLTELVQLMQAHCQHNNDLT